MKKYISTFAAGLFFVSVMALLIAMRFVTPTTVETKIIASSSPTFTQNGQTLRRGEIIKTSKGEYLALMIGPSIRIGMDENTTIELTRIFEDERLIHFTRGRIMIESLDKTPLLVETNHTQSLIQNGTASMVNYDFLENISLIPFTGSIVMNFKKTQEYQLIPVPVNIHEVEPVSITPIEFKKDEGAYKAFYAWYEGIQKN